ncbi:RDD family protein [Prosthecobacter sp.]|uniref:RDD family protein n=1 Tax=Prosthecobacter sp. TaxID=1965333 RepID=UPI001DFDE812|nr:RDD family protein [Prosthecobacter sp.]MCB1275798.1 RDD family protein [Prosthecobacter sp.]
MNPDDINPYAAPQSTVVNIEAVPVSEAPSAGGGKRFLNFLIDRVAILGIFFVMGIVLVILDERGITHRAASFFDDINTLQDMLITGLAGVVYYGCLEGAWGRSLGKWITGTKVVTVSGEPLKFGTVLGRSLVRMVPFEAFSFLGGDASGWHDKWSGTRVIDLRAAPVPKPRPMSAGNMPRFYQPTAPVPGNTQPPPPPQA